MIVYLLWNARGRARDSAQSTNMIRFDSIIRIVIDSGLGYTLLSLALFFSQLVRSNAIFITCGAEFQAVGIAFNLINIRVAALRNEEQEAPIVYSGKASTGRPIKFATISALSHQPSSALVSLRGTEEKHTPIVRDDCSFA